MPTYEYACKGCGEHLEVVQSFRDDALTECPACGGTLRKVFSAAGLIFKGSGWHIKDYAGSSSSSGPAAAEGKGDAKGDGAARSDAKSDAKSDTKSDAKSSSSDASSAGSSSSSEAKSA